MSHITHSSSGAFQTSSSSSSSRPLHIEESLSIFGNLIRCNNSIKSQIQSHQESKTLYRALIGLLSDEGLTTGT